MSSNRSRSLRVMQDPGPVDEDDPATCADCPAHNPEDAAFRVVDPRYDIGTVSALCPYHLARLRDEYPGRWRKMRQHPRINGLEAATTDHALIELEDVPPEVEVDGERYCRVGLDRKGRAYFARDEGDRYRLIETDARFNVRESTAATPGGLASAFDHVERRVGWESLAEEWQDRALEAESRGGGA